MRTPLALAGLALLAAGLPLAAPAQAAAPTCQGKEATIVGTYTAEGTDGDDVIVLTGANQEGWGVSAKGGDDLICVTGNWPGPTDGGGGASFSGGPGNDSVVIRTGDGNDSITLSPDVEHLDMDLGGGFDELRAYSAGLGGRIDAGADGGTVKMYDFDEVRLHLSKRLLRLDGVRYEIRGFYRAFASGRRVVLSGDEKANGLSAWACRTTLRGRAGKDTLQAGVDTGVEGCTPKGAHMFGEAGDDRMSGTSGRDTLIGGPGNDKASGGLGRDRCVAERRQGCER